MKSNNGSLKLVLIILAVIGIAVGSVALVMHYPSLFKLGLDLQGGVVCGEIQYSAIVTPFQQLFLGFQLAILALFLPVFHIFAPSVVKWVDSPPGTRETPSGATSAEHGEQVL